jgi:hypothetical protein
MIYLLGFLLIGEMDLYVSWAANHLIDRVLRIQSLLDSAENNMQSDYPYFTDALLTLHLPFVIKVQKIYRL